MRSAGLLVCAILGALTLFGCGEPAGDDTGSSASGVGGAAVRVSYKVEGPMSGTSTLWLDGAGSRAGLREELGPGSSVRVDTHWDGSTAHVRDGSKPVARSSSRPMEMQLSPVTMAKPEELAMAGWTRAGERTIAGKTCAVWTNSKVAGGVELCVWRGLDLQFLTLPKADGTFAMRKEATEIVEGENIPSDIVALAE